MSASARTGMTSTPAKPRPHARRDVCGSLRIAPAQRASERRCARLQLPLTRRIVMLAVAREMLRHDVVEDRGDAAPLPTRRVFETDLHVTRHAPTVHFPLGHALQCSAAPRSDQPRRGPAAALRRTNGTIVAHLEHWPSNPLTLGSYTCYLPGQFTTIAGLEGLPVDNLYFAGEHANSFYDWQGFMEGAALSGIDVATAILRAARRL